MHHDGGDLDEHHHHDQHHHLPPHRGDLSARCRTGEENLTEQSTFGATVNLALLLGEHRGDGGDREQSNDYDQKF